MKVVHLKWVAVTASIIAAGIVAANHDGNFGWFLFIAFMLGTTTTSAS